MLQWTHPRSERRKENYWMQGKNTQRSLGPRQDKKTGVSGHLRIGRRRTGLCFELVRYQRCSSLCPDSCVSLTLRHSQHCCDVCQTTIAARDTLAWRARYRKGVHGLRRSLRIILATAKRQVYPALFCKRCVRDLAGLCYRQRRTEDSGLGLKGCQERRQYSIYCAGL